MILKNLNFEIVFLITDLVLASMVSTRSGQSKGAVVSNNDKEEMLQSTGESLSPIKEVSKDVSPHEDHIEKPQEKEQSEDPSTKSVEKIGETNVTEEEQDGHGQKNVENNSEEERKRDEEMTKESERVGTSEQHGAEIVSSQITHLDETSTMEGASEIVEVLLNNNSILQVLFFYFYVFKITHMSV